jgi:xylulokinase
MKKLLLGIDIGTSSVKGTVIDTDGHVIVQSSQEQSLSSPNPGWAEEAPQDWWSNTIHAIQDCLGHSDVSADQIAGVGTTGMVPAIVLLDDQKKPVRPSIQQNDARTAQEIIEFQQKFDQERFFNLTGSTLSQQSVGPKLVWLQRHEPDIWEQVDLIMGSYDYINFCLTGSISLEVNWALESGMYAIKTRNWSDELLQLFGADRDLFPPVHMPSDVIGSISGEVAKQTGLRQGTPVVAGSADHVAAAFAAGVQDEGDLLVKVGSAGDILYSCDSLVLDQRLFIDFHDIPGKYFLNGCMATSGSLLKWYVQQFCQADVPDAAQAGKDIYAYLDEKAAAIAPGCDGVIVLPYFFGEKTPVFDAQARGIFFGLTLFHTRYHLYRAILEAVVFGFKHHVRVLEERCLPIKRVLISEGGAKSLLWRQITADALNCPVTFLKENPGASLASAFIAGIGVGVFDSWSDIHKYIERESTTQPIPENNQVYKHAFKIYLQLYQNLKQTFRDAANS